MFLAGGAEEDVPALYPKEGGFLLLVPVGVSLFMGWAFVGCEAEVDALLEREGLLGYQGAEIRGAEVPVEDDVALAFAFFS